MDEILTVEAGIQKPTETDFAPDEHQRRYLEALCDPEVEPLVHKLAEAAGVSRITVWRWHQIPGFDSWVERERERLMHASLSGVHGAMLRSALKDNTPAHRLYLERFDKMFQTRGDDTVRAPITLVLNQQINVEAGGDDLLADLAQVEKK